MDYKLVRIFLDLFNVAFDAVESKSQDVASILICSFISLILCE